MAILVGKVYAVGVSNDLETSAPHDEEHSKLPRTIQKTATIFTVLSLSKMCAGDDRMVA